MEANNQSLFLYRDTLLLSFRLIFWKDKFLKRPFFRELCGDQKLQVVFLQEIELILFLKFPSPMLLNSKFLLHVLILVNLMVQCTQTFPLIING